MISSQICEKFK